MGTQGQAHSKWARHQEVLLWWTAPAPGEADLSPSSQTQGVVSGGAGGEPQERCSEAPEKLSLQRATFWLKLPHSHLFLLRPQEQRSQEPPRLTLPANSSPHSGRASGHICLYEWLHFSQDVYVCVCIYMYSNRCMHMYLHMWTCWCVCAYECLVQAQALVFAHTCAFWAPLPLTPFPAWVGQLLGSCSWFLLSWVYTLTGDLILVPSFFSSLMKTKLPNPCLQPLTSFSSSKALFSVDNLCKSQTQWSPIVPYISFPQTRPPSSPNDAWDRHGCPPSRLCSHTSPHRRRVTSPCEVQPLSFTTAVLGQALPITHLLPGLPTSRLSAPIHPIQRSRVLFISMNQTLSFPIPNLWLGSCGLWSQLCLFFWSIFDL